MTEVILREVTGDWDDADLIVSWRNDPDTARAFPPQEPWTLEGQQNWYHDVYLRDPSLNLYFVELDGWPIGTVGMKVKDGTFEMMWMMLGEKGYARLGYMRQGMRKLMEAYGPGHYWGRVMPDNGAGLRFQVSNGFSIVGAKDGMILISRDFDGTWPEAS